MAAGFAPRLMKNIINDDYDAVVFAIFSFGSIDLLGGIALYQFLLKLFGIVSAHSEAVEKIRSHLELISLEKETIVALIELMFATLKTPHYWKELNVFAQQ